MAGVSFEGAKVGFGALFGGEEGVLEREDLVLEGGVAGGGLALGVACGTG